MALAILHQGSCRCSFRSQGLPRGVIHVIGQKGQSKLQSSSFSPWHSALGMQHWLHVIGVGDPYRERYRDSWILDRVFISLSTLVAELRHFHVTSICYCRQTAVDETAGHRGTSSNRSMTTSTPSLTRPSSLMTIASSMAASPVTMTTSASASHQSSQNKKANEQEIADISCHFGLKQCRGRWPTPARGLASSSSSGMT